MESKSSDEDNADSSDPKQKLQQKRSSKSSQSDSEAPEYLESTEEELEEERQDAAARLIQGLYRAKRARKLIRDLVKSNFIKEYDPYTGYFLYRNKRTNQTQWTKPIFLGDEDLPDPVVWKAPAGYTAREQPVRQFALVLTNTKYEHKRLLNLPSCLRRDQEVLRNVMTNPYISQFDPGDCTFLMDATLQAFTIALEEITQRCHEEEEPCALLIYICSYICYVRKGPNKNSYILMTDTNYRNQGFVARTSFSFTKFARIIRKVKCDEKNIILDVAHQKKRDEGFRTFGLYPPANLYQVLADASGAAVIGSCRLGSVEEMHQTNTNKASNKVIKSNEQTFDVYAGDPLDDVDDGTFADVKMFANMAADENMSLVSDTSILRAMDAQMPTFGVFAGLGPADRLPPRKLLPALKDKAVSGAKEVHTMIKSSSSKKTSKVRTDHSLYWNPEHIEEIIEELKEKDEPNSESEEEEEKEIRDMDSVTGHVRQKYGGKKEFGVIITEHSIFGARLIRGMRGEACQWESENVRVTAAELHSYLEETIKADVASFDKIVHPPPKKKKRKTDDAKVEDSTGKKKTYLERKEEEEKRRKEIEKEKRRKPPPPPLQQVPVIAFPSQYTSAVKKNMCTCSKPSVPPFPYTPDVVEVHQSMVALQWSDPQFDGAEIVKYEIQGKGKTRVNRDWHTLCSYANITYPYFKIPNLVPGVELMFRVRALNHGGWGEYSWETDFIMPNPVERSISLARDLRQAAEFGPRQVISVMKKRSHLLEVQQQGAKQLLAMAARHGGFKRISVAKECVTAILEAMKKFSKDKTMQSLGCLVIGWACKTGEEVVDEALNKGAEKVIIDMQSTFKGDISVVNHSKWLFSIFMNKDDLSLSTADESWVRML